MHHHLRGAISATVSATYFVTRFPVERHGYSCFAIIEPSPHSICLRVSARFKVLYPSFLRIVGPDADFAEAVGALFRKHHWRGASILFAGGVARGSIYASLAWQVLKPREVAVPASLPLLQAALLAMSARIHISSSRLCFHMKYTRPHCVSFVFPMHPLSHLSPPPLSQVRGLLERQGTQIGAWSEFSGKEACDTGAGDAPSARAAVNAAVQHGSDGSSGGKFVVLVFGECADYRQASAWVELYTGTDTIVPSSKPRAFCILPVFSSKSLIPAAFVRAQPLSEHGFTSPRSANRVVSPLRCEWILCRAKRLMRAWTRPRNIGI